MTNVVLRAAAISDHEAYGQGLADATVFERIQIDVKAEIDTGVQFALSAPYPDANQVDQDVYA